MVTCFLIAVLAAYLICGSTANKVEITPVSAQHSATFRGMNRYGPHHVIDGNWRTKTMTVQDYDGEYEHGTWVTVSLGGVYCVETVEVWHYMNIPTYMSSFTCNQEETSCHSCQGYCAKKTRLAVTVYTEGTDPNPEKKDPGCMRGDTVKVRNRHGHMLSFHEVKVYAKADE